MCSRAFIRAVDGDDALEVPSPTYLLENVYDEHEGTCSTTTLTANLTEHTLLADGGGCGPYMRVITHCIIAAHLDLLSHLEG